MKRLLTAIGLIAVAVYLIFWAPHPIFLAAALCMGLLCYSEFSGLVVAYGIQRPGVFGLLAGVLIIIWPEATLLGVVLLLILALAWSLRQVDLRQILPQVACTFLGTFYAFAPWRFAAGLRAQSVHLLFFALALNWIGDSAAYYAGRKFGKHRLAPIVSPKKSWEGAGASIAASIVFGVLYLGWLMPQVPWWQVALMAGVGNVAGQVGDLVESAFKRGAGVKDSGSLLPGHGGMLDRVDSSLFALPVVYGIYLLGLRF
jgi:phosphatidate cytidylyltransferase